MRAADRQTIFQFQLTMLLVPLFAVIVTLATNRSMDDTLHFLLIFFLIFSLGFMGWLMIRLRTWLPLLLPSTIMDILTLAITIRGTNAHGRIDAALDIAFNAVLFCFIAAGFWIRWKNGRNKRVAGH